MIGAKQLNLRVCRPFALSVQRFDLPNVALYSRSSLATTQAEPPAPCGYITLLFG